MLDELINTTSIIIYSLHGVLTTNLNLKQRQGTLLWCFYNKLELNNKLELKTKRGYFTVVFLQQT